MMNIMNLYVKKEWGIFKLVSVFRLGGGGLITSSMGSSVVRFVYLLIYKYNE